MPWYLRMIIVACGVLLFNALPAQQRESGVWQILHGCQLVDAADNQGDRFKVQHANQTFSIRLYFVESPEADDSDLDRVRDQARYFSLPETDIISAGKVAKKFSERFLRGTFTVITQWQDARASKGPGYFALIEKEGRLLSAELLQHGAARLYGMPTQSSWPGGLAPRAYLNVLKQHERTAQRTAAGIWAQATAAPQLAALPQLGHTHNTATTAPQDVALATSSPTGKIILNTADAAALQSLPGIGPALAARIIAARPLSTLDALTAIPGISANTIDAFRAWVLVDAPPPPPYTAAFYLADRASYLNREVTVHVTSVAQTDLAAPASFRAVRLHTTYNGADGGAIDTFIPDEFYDSFIQYYRQPGRDLTALLFQYDSDVVLVYRRK